MWNEKNMQSVHKKTFAKLIFQYMLYILKQTLTNPTMYKYSIFSRRSGDMKLLNIHEIHIEYELIMMIKDMVDL